VTKIGIWILRRLFGLRSRTFHEDIRAEARRMSALSDDEWARHMVAYGYRVRGSQGNPNHDH
jgi:hypothetical protein